MFLRGTLGLILGNRKILKYSKGQAKNKVQQISKMPLNMKCVLENGGKQDSENVTEIVEGEP